MGKVALLFVDCRTNPLGIQQSLRYVTDAQMTSYRGYTSSSASYARVGGSSYWYGRDKDAYVQIDFGNTFTFVFVITISLSEHFERFLDLWTLLQLEWQNVKLLWAQNSFTSDLMKIP